MSQRMRYRGHYGRRPHERSSQRTVETKSNKIGSMLKRTRRNIFAGNSTNFANARARCKWVGRDCVKVIAETENTTGTTMNQCRRQDTMCTPELPNPSAEARMHVLGHTSMSELGSRGAGLCLLGEASTPSASSKPKGSFSSNICWNRSDCCHTPILT